MNKTKLIIVALTVIGGVFAGLYFTTPPTVIVSDEFMGDGIMIVFDWEEGETAWWSLDGYELRVPETGVLRLTNGNINFGRGKVVNERGELIWGEDVGNQDYENHCPSNDVVRSSLFLFNKKRMTLDSVTGVFIRAGIHACDDQVHSGQQ